MRKFLETETWKWIRTVIQIAGIVFGVYLLILFAEWLGI